MATPGGVWYSKYQNPATSDKQRQQLWNTYGKRYGWTPYQAPAAATPAATAAPATEAPVDTSANYPYRAAFGGNLSQPDVNSANKVGTVQSYVTPYAESPLYKHQREQGLNDLSRLYAKRGLVGSSAEIKGTSDFLNQLGSQEAERAFTLGATDQANQSKLQATDLAARLGLYGTNLGALQTEGQRLTDVQQAESTRQANEKQANWNNLFNALTFLGNQNPMSQAYGATNAAGNGLVQGGGLVYPQAPAYVPNTSGMMGAASGGLGGVQWGNVLDRLFSSIWGGK